MKPRTFYSFVTRLRGFLDNHDIPPLNGMKHSPYNFPFWSLVRAKCCKEMFTIDKNQIPCDSIKQIFLEHKLSHNDLVSIHTDGSKNDHGVGFAVVTEDHVVHRCLPSYSLVYTAGLGAISIALSNIPYQSHKNYIIYTDSKSLLQAISSLCSDHPGISNIHETVHLLGQKYITVTF